MTPIHSFLANHGPMLLLGITLILAMAAILIALHKQPIHRQRLAESAMLLCILFIILALIPLPRFSFATKYSPTKPPPKYTLQPGDEVIAAQVFKYPRSQELHNSASALKKGISTVSDEKGISTVSAKKGISTFFLPNYPRLFSTLYLAGVVASILWLLLGHLFLLRLIRGAEPADPSLRNSLNLPPRIRLLISDHTDRPLSFGLFRPTILLPAHCLKNQTQLRHILLHELAHISQRDSLGHLLFNLLFPILYFHPLYWWLRRLTNLSRELIADDLAAASSSRESYAADLLSLARDRISHAALATHALGLFQSKTDFYRRMHMLVATHRPLSRRCSGFWRAGCAALLIILLMLTSGSLGVRRANAQAANPFAAADDKKNAEDKAIAADRDAEVQKLKAEQAQLQAQLAELAAQRKQLEYEIQMKRDIEAKATDVNAKTLEERMRNKRYQELKADPAAAQKANPGERVAMEAFISKKDPRAANRDANDFNPRPQLDLVSLANNYVDAVGNLQLAEIELERLAGNKNNAFSKYEVDSQKMRVQIAQRKVNIFKAIAQAALDAAKTELQFGIENHNAGLAPVSTVTDAKARIRILEVILAQ
jgi:beta-lactamase regulating signal transducer with metallopeptidase domain